MKILLSAYACEPGQGSEEGVGWNMALAIARHHEVWVLTRTFSRLAIETELVCNPVANLHFIYFEPLNWSADWKGKQGAVQLHYYFWQIQAYAAGQKLYQQINFDIIHHVTYVKFWSPSFLALLPVPFIWGPVGGGESAPKPFWRDFSLRAKTYEILRDLAQRVGERDPFTRLTAQRSILAQATTEDTAKRLRALAAKNVQVFSEAGLSQSEIACLARIPIQDRAPIRFISTGRLLHWKGYHLSLQAFLQANLPNAEYWVLGDGAERKRLQAMVEDRKASHLIKFFGRLPRHEVLQKLQECHVLVHPSLHDSGGWTCLEAMAAGRPVICLDLGGPAVQVTQETGIKISAHDPAQTVQDLATAMTTLAHNPELRVRMGQAAKRRVNEVFTWEIKGRYFSQIYQEIADERIYPASN
jgi:glycosyltransferase involved in cell wall biosynthesis